MPEVRFTVFSGSSSQPGVVAPQDQLPVPVIWLSNRIVRIGKTNIVWQRAAARLLTGKFDVIICSEVVHNLTVWTVWLLRRLFGQRFVVHAFGYRPEPAGFSVPSLRQRLRLLLLRRADAIICYTERGRRACLEAGIEPAKLFVSLNTLDTAGLEKVSRQVSEEQVAALRDRLAIQGNLVLLHIGRLRDFNRVDVLIDAARQLARQGQPVNLLVIGDGPARHRLQEHAAGLKGTHFMGPIYEEGELAPFFALSDLVVRPVRIGLTCVHAFSYGLPVMTTSDAVAEQTPEYDYIASGVNGCIVGSLEPKGFADAISGLIHEPELLASMKMAARETAESLTIEHMAAQFVAATLSAAGRQPEVRKP